MCAVVKSLTWGECYFQYWSDLGCHGVTAAAFMAKVGGVDESFPYKHIQVTQWNGQRVKHQARGTRFFSETLTEGSAACDVRVAWRTVVCCSVLCESPVAFGSSRGLSFWASAHKFLWVEVTILFCLKFPWFFIRDSGEDEYCWK